MRPMQRQQGPQGFQFVGRNVLGNFQQDEVGELGLEKVRSGPVHAPRKVVGFVEIPVRPEPSVLGVADKVVFRFFGRDWNNFSVSLLSITVRFMNPSHLVCSRAAGSSFYLSILLVVVKGVLNT